MAAGGCVADDLERNRERTIDRRTLKGLMELLGIWSDIRSVAVAVSAELTFEHYDADAAVELLVQTTEDVRAMRAKAPRGGRAYARAARTWCDHELPDEVAELFDLDRQPWRTLQAMACARVRLLAAQGEFAAAAEIADRLCMTASAHGLTRTLLRGLALSMVVAERVGRTGPWPACSSSCLWRATRAMSGRWCATGSSVGLSCAACWTECSTPTRATPRYRCSPISTVRRRPLRPFHRGKWKCSWRFARGRRNREIADPREHGPGLVNGTADYRTLAAPRRGAGGGFTGRACCSRCH